MATLTRNTREEHRTGHLLGTVSTQSGVQTLLSLVGTLVTRAAIEVECWLERDQPVLHRNVALSTLDVVNGYMGPVNQLGVRELFHPFGFIVAVVATGLLGQA
jgi:hypothetical protein